MRTPSATAVNSPCRVGSYSSGLVTVALQVSRLRYSISHLLTYFVAVLISIDQNPTDFGVFNTSTSGVELPFAVPFFNIHNAGQLCIPVDITSLNIPGVQAGSNITLQVMQVGSAGNLYQVRPFTLF